MVVPVVVPFTSTAAPMSGSPFSSKTTPVSLAFCAVTAREASIKHTVARILNVLWIFFIIVLLFDSDFFI